MLGVYPDPLVSVSPLILHSPDISTFRVSLQNDLSERVTVKDYTSQFALHGFAEVGGLWTIFLLRYLEVLSSEFYLVPTYDLIPILCF